MNKATEDYIKQWILKANEDILVVEKLTESGIFAASECHYTESPDKLVKRRKDVFRKI